MNVFATLRLVPPIAPEAFAWAILSFATYLAALEAEPVLFGHVLSPLALALVVQMVLRLTKNMTSESSARSMQELPYTYIVLLAFGMGGLAGALFYGSEAAAAVIFICYLLGNAALIFAVACHAPHRLERLDGPWTRLKQGSVGAMKLRATGTMITAATMLLVWHLAGTLAFAAMMSFGVLIMHAFIDWIIVLYLLDLRERAADE